ncbi:MAG: hypothetical protein AB7O56_02595 [Bauldia sp.]
MGIKMGSDLYWEFRRRRLLVPKLADLAPFATWSLPGYRDKYVYDDFDLAAEAFAVGSPEK